MTYERAIDHVAAQTKSNGGERKPNTACAIGAFRASAIGARRSRSSIAPICGDVPVPDKDLPVVLPQDLIPDGSGNPC